MKSDTGNKKPLPPGWREVVNHISSVNNGRNYYLHDDGTTVLVRPVAGPVVEDSNEISQIGAGDMHEVKSAPLGTVFGRKYFGEFKGDKQPDIRLFSAGAPVSQDRKLSTGKENPELVLEAVEVQAPRPPTESKFSLEELTVDVYSLNKGKKNDVQKKDGKP